MDKRRVVTPFSSEYFLSHSTETFRRINKVKNIGKGWDSHPDQPLPNPVVLPTVPWEQSELLTNVIDIMKRFERLRFEPGPTA